MTTSEQGLQTKKTTLLERTLHAITKPKRRSDRKKAEITRDEKEMRPKKLSPHTRAKIRKTWIAVMLFTLIGAVVAGLWVFFHLLGGFETSPVYGRNTPSDRLAQRPELDLRVFETARQAALAESAVQDLQIEQRGPILYFNVTVADTESVDEARKKAEIIAKAFVSAVADEQFFTRYEGQFIIQRMTPNTISEEEMLKDPKATDNIHPFPQFGTMNKQTEAAISWSNNKS